MKKFCAAILLMLIMVEWSGAVRVKSLYTAEMPLASQTEELKEQAVKEGFLQVLIRMSGNTKIADNPLIKSTLKKADYYVQEFDYSLPTTNSSHYQLNIRYDEEDMSRLLKKAGVPYWNENRPLILIWLTFTDAKQQTEVIGNETSTALITLIKGQSNRFGLPLIFPMMDAYELSKISVTDIQNMSLATLREAAKRYSPDALLIGTIEEKTARIQSHWRLIMNNQQANWTIEDKTSEGIIQTIMNEVSQALAKVYIAKSEAKNTLSLDVKVVGIKQKTDLEQLIQYLKQFKPMKAVEVNQMNDEGVHLSLRILSSLNDFQQHASINQHLVLTSEDTTHHQLIYKWIQQP